MNIRPSRAVKNANDVISTRRVADLGLPPGCLLITIQREDRDEVPSRDTVLRAGDRLTAVVPPAEVGGIETLRHGADYRG